NPSYAIALTNRGQAHQQAGDYDRAIADLDEAIRINPNSATAFNQRGLAHLRAGRSARAVDDFEQALRLDPNHADALRNRRLGLGDHRAAAGGRAAGEMRPDAQLGRM